MMMLRSCTVRRSLILALLLLLITTRSRVSCFSVNTSANENNINNNKKNCAQEREIIIQVSKIENFENDFNSLFQLADVRYDEWVRKEEGGGGGDKTTSRQAFRIATLEIYQEERPDSIVILAKLQTNNRVVGAAELSPIEVQNVLKIQDRSPSSEEEEELSPETSTAAAATALYITDVVTNSNYRRKGIGRTLIDALEQEAIKRQRSNNNINNNNNNNVIYLLLHVMQDNKSALDFYHRLGYIPPSKDLLRILDTKQLADNANAQGQVLLCKSITSKKSQQAR